MREILFRGKKIDDKEWFHGNLLKLNKKTYLVPQNTWFDYGRLKVMVEVGPDTVGQYTGLTDKNGKKIFEGDIVELNIKGYTTICKVAWADNVAQFQLWQTNTIPHTSTALNFGNYDCEIIGNIHDNRELLKGGAE